jgi:hypothetical protein
MFNVRVPVIDVYFLSTFSYLGYVFNIYNNITFRHLFVYLFIYLYKETLLA